MKSEPIFKSVARARVVHVRGDLARELRARGLHHCGDLKPVDPAPTCQFCGEGCDGLH